MIKNKRGQTYMHENTCFFIGQEIVANDKSDYAGLTGIIKEIRDGEDKDTDNPAADVYCDFELPENEFFLAKLTARFDMPAEEISLDSIIMSPDMIEAKAEYQINPAATPLYVLSFYTDNDSNGQSLSAICLSPSLELLKDMRQLHMKTSGNFTADGEFSLDGFEVCEFIANDNEHMWTAENYSSYFMYQIAPVEYLGSRNGGGD